MGCTHPRRLAGDQQMLLAESDSYVDAIGRPDRDDRIVAEALARPVPARTANDDRPQDARFPRKPRPFSAAPRLPVEAQEQVFALLMFGRGMDDRGRPNLARSFSLGSVDAVSYISPTAEAEA